jgi:queuine/archaeosine tRNA-ribosyltransferase
MAGMRAAISAGTFAAFRQAVLEAYGSDDAEPVTAPGGEPPGQEEAS